MDDCFLTDKDRLTHSEALAILRARVSCVVGTERVALTQAAGRTLAEAVRAPRPVPFSDNSAVDGYAFNHADYEANGGRLRVSMRLAAGAANEEPLPAGTTARIFTGASMPPGADSIAMQEDVIEEGGLARLPSGLRRGANRRKAGEDLAEGDLIAEPGRVLRPQDAAALASIGRSDALVYELLRVAMISTGDEIIRPPRELRPGEVYDSNHILLHALLAGIGARTTDFGILPDDPKIIEEALSTAAASHHAILSTGGASRGEEDYLALALSKLGRRHVWQIAVKPGRPMGFGQIGAAAALALPGNPVAAMVCFLLYARPLLLALGGASWREPTRFAVAAEFEMSKKPDRREFLRGLLRPGAFPPRVSKYPRDGSGLIAGLREADGLIEIPEETTRVAPGDSVAFIPFAEFGAA